ncbi:MAG: HPP family protein [Thermodesulfobacteriota bacterium]
MKLTARDIMVTEFDTIQCDAPVEQAVRLIFNGKTRATGHKTVSVMVVNRYGNLVGVLSMFDILYHMRPPILNCMVDAIQFGQEELNYYIQRFKGLKAEQVMHSPVSSVTAEDDLMVIIDRMVKEKIRRLPVLEHDKIIGIVYLSEVYYHMCKNWLKIELA